MRNAGLDVTAEELKPHATEWHHAGFLPNGRGMGKCYWFKEQTYKEQWVLYTKVLEAREAASAPRYGWKVDFTTSRGTYGKKKYQPISCVQEFAPGETMTEKWEQLTIEDYQKLLPHNGAKLLPYESLESFKKRI